MPEDAEGIRMSEHYYSSAPSSKSRPQVIEAKLRGRTFRFETDAGVFSKNEVDFGTRLLIETMEIPADARVLDVGCGYGPIGIVAATLAEEGFVTMIDTNGRAAVMARRNAERLGLKNVRVLEGDRFAPLAEGESFDVVLTNPPIRAGKDIVHSIFEGAYERLNPGGSLWVVIQKKQGAPSALAKLESLFGDVRVAEKDKGYRVYQAVKKADNSENY